MLHLSRLGLVAAAALALAVLAPPPARATIIQDQGVFDASIANFAPIGETFVAVDAQIGTIAFAFSDLNPTFANTPVTMTLRQGTSLTGTVIRSVTQTLPAVLPGTLATPQFIDFNFNGTMLTPGQSYTVTVTTSSFKAGVVYSGSDVYPNGSLVYGQNSLGGCPSGGGCDLNFRIAPSGGSPTTPVLPTSTPTPGTFVFSSQVIRPRLWFDPPLVSGFQYDLVGGTFIGVQAAAGFDDLQVEIGGVIVDPDLDSTETFTFGPGVSSFKLLGIAPPVDAADPSAFPTFLDFTDGATQLTMTALVPTAVGVPAPATAVLLAAGLGLVAWARRRG